MKTITDLDALRRILETHSAASVADRLGISETYLEAMLTRKLAVTGFVAVRLERHYGIDSRKLLIDQALVEYECARMEYAREVTA